MDRPQATGEDQSRLAGTIVAERYRLLEQIGHGGMGVVYRAEHILMRKTLALKLLHPQMGEIEEIAQRFEREAQSSSRLSHEHIIQVTDFGRTSSGDLYLAMELVQGTPLGTVIHQSIRLPIPRALGVLRQVLGALEHAHTHGVVHRDLKPENIMLASREGGRDFVKILDFGIAKLKDDVAAAERTNLTQAGSIFGTPDYMSPEQALGEEVDGRTDLYACGVILFEMLTGRKPFVAPDMVKVLSMQLTAPAPSPRTVVPEAGISSALDAAVLKALEKKREQRFQTAREFRGVLDAIERGGPKSGFVALAASAPKLKGVLGRLELVFSRLPKTVRTVALVMAGIFLFGLVALLRSSKRPTASAPPPVQQIEPAIEQSLKPIEEALAHGDLLKARAALTLELSKHPEIARVHYLLGNLDFVEHRPETGLASYREAIRLDGGYRGDRALLRNVQLLLEDKKLGDKALDLLIHEVGKPACGALAQMASTERRSEPRKSARAATQQLGCTEKIDQVQTYLLDLAQGKTCEERKAAAIELGKLADPRALAPLRNAHDRRAGLFNGFARVNHCALKEIEAAIKAIREKG